jgi:hypothetical protein
MVFVFYEELLKTITGNDYLNDFSWGWLLLLIPGIYLVGHAFGTVSFLLLRLYVVIDKCFKKPKEGKDESMSKARYRLLMLIQCILYRQRVVYTVSKYLKTEKGKANKYFNNMDEFWTTCAILQIEKIYTPAEYWNYLNEFFNSINMVFFISSIIAFMRYHWVVGIIYLVLAILAFYRAQLYAQHFVQTVVRTMEARDVIVKKLSVPRR